MTRLLAFLLAGLLAAAQSAEAQTCTATSTGLAFGSYDTTLAAPTDSTGTITVTCSAVIALFVSYTLSLSVGSGSSYGARWMVGPLSSHLGYQIYNDTGRSKIWGDGTASTFTVTDGYALSIIAPVVRPYIAYARIPARQTALAAGAFSDAVTITVSY